MLKAANILLAFLAGICLVLAGILAVQKYRGPADQRRTPVVRAIEQAMPAVVSLSVNSSGHDPEGERAGTYFAGSGSIIDKSGLILTNAHVVAGAPRVGVTLSSGAFCPARLVAEDLQNDIALLQLEEPPVLLPVIPMAQTGRLLLGETVIAVGTPFGLDGSITVGVLSGINRSLASGKRLLFSDLLQTDAAVFPGNSGGPLINLNGRMIGMNMAIKRNAPGIGFAIPMLRIENVLAGFLLPERFAGLNFGIRPEADQTGAVFAAEVFPDSPAEKAGIRPGMKLLAYEGKNPAGFLLELSKKWIRLKPGKAVRMTFETLGTVEVTPVPFPENDGICAAEWKLGILVENLDHALAEALRYPMSSGVIVSGVRDQRNRAVNRGDLIIRLNGVPTPDTATLGQVLNGLSAGNAVSAEILSPDGKNLYRKTVRLNVF